jgi:glutamate racemase
MPVRRIIPKSNGPSESWRLMDRPIGVFDSGLGGLTVLAALRQRLPNEQFVYFGDTARVPYGIKSSLTVRRYSRQDTAFLRRFNPKLTVVACNTASAAGLDVVSDEAGVPVVGVIDPGAARAVAAAEGRPIGIIGTESTIASRSYYRAIRLLDAKCELWEKACPLLVPMVEEGRLPEDPLVAAAVEEYLSPLQGRVSALVLGCTHYPLLKPALAAFMGPEVALVDSAEEVARRVATMLDQQSLTASGGPGGIRCYVSDNPDRFRTIGQQFLGTPLRDVTLVEPEEFFAAEETATA